MLLYNCRSQTVEGRDQGAMIRELFPPLKALADETRLEIIDILSDGEMYAQQIVGRMSITQPAVSRHLKLMVTGGVLKERKQNGMKFYSINAAMFAKLGIQLSGYGPYGTNDTDSLDS
ncbi:ArsR/SmtB family transcription factor [Candidatus Bipolaricaulota bacterium]